MLQLAVKYFGNLFSTLEAGADDRLFGIVEKRIFTLMNVKLLKQFNEEEIGATAKDMAPLKAIGYCIFFGDASSEGANVVRNTIREYKTISRQRIFYQQRSILTLRLPGGVSVRLEN